MIGHKSILKELQEELFKTEKKRKLAINCRPPYCSGSFSSNKFSYINNKKMKTIEITQEEIRQATRPNIYRNRKKYTRKIKHSKREY